MTMTDCHYTAASAYLGSVIMMMVRRFGLTSTFLYAPPPWDEIVQDGIGVVC